jgi:folate-binding protein YgfZ
MNGRNTMMAEDITRSCRVVRSGAAWFDRTEEGRIEVRGTDRIGWLQGLLTNDVAALHAGQGCYSAYLTPQGRMITDLRVLVRDRACWLDLPGVASERVLQRLETFIISEDVELRDLRSTTIRLSVHGPTSALVVARALVPGDAGSGPAIAALPEHGHLALRAPMGEVVVASSCDLGVPGVDLYADASARDALVTALERGGAVSLGVDTWEACRIEAGRPRYGADMDENTIPLEAGIEDRAISFTKGCYVGQEVIVRVRDRGQGRVARRLMGLAAEDTETVTWATVSAGDPLFAGDRDVGRVTSATFSPSLRTTIALGYVHRDHAVEGQRLVARHDTSDVGMTVVRLPFVAPAPTIPSA